MISAKEVKHIAKLARLGISKKEERSFQKELSSILDYVEKLKELDISEIKEIKPTSHPLKIENVMREDEARNQLSKFKIQKLLKLVPELKQGFVKVKSILK